jgi:hypothetical protein
VFFVYGLVAGCYTFLFAPNPNISSNEDGFFPGYDFFYYYFGELFVVLAAVVWTDFGYYFGGYVFLPKKLSKNPPELVFLGSFAFIFSSVIFVVGFY